VSRKDGHCEGVPSLTVVIWAADENTVARTALCAETGRYLQSTQKPGYPLRGQRVEFRVTGTPISNQSHNRQLLAEWRAAVAYAASEEVGGGFAPVTDDVELKVVYYYVNGSAQIPDEDNLLKPIQDALIGIIYQDDSQVVDGSCHKRDLDGRFQVRRLSQVLADAFVQGDEFVHVIVRDAPDSGVLQR
jgi:crossover junction endodeoxyribonuclease RusA